MLGDVCETIKNALPCNLSPLFGTVIDELSLSIKDGEGEIKDYTGVNGDVVKICSDTTIDCDNDKISPSLIFKTFTIRDDNKIDFDYKYIELDIDNVSIIEDLNILVISSEVKAFEAFKNKVGNYIFIIPTNTNIASKQGDSLSVVEDFQIIIYLYNKDGVSDYEYIEQITDIENSILNTIYNNNALDYKFKFSEYVFSTDYTIIKKLHCSFNRDIPLVNDNCYVLEPQYKFCEKE
jgi:hypothetical protein